MTASTRVFQTEVEINGTLVPLSITRMVVNDWTAFKTAFRQMKARADRQQRLLDAAVTEDEYEAALALEQKNDQLASTFTHASITKYVTAPDAGLVDASGEPVISGQQLFDFYSYDTTALSAILAAIFLEHLLTADQKKALRLARGSANGSDASTTQDTDAGGRPAPTAVSAEPLGTAESAPATDRPVDSPSGDPVG